MIENPHADALPYMHYQQVAQYQYVTVPGAFCIHTVFMQLHLRLRLRVEGC